MKVLIVDNSPAVRLLLEHLIRSSGHEITSCEDSETAWIKYQHEVHPLVILESQLIKMDGLQLCREIRAHPQGDQSVILMYTQNDKTGDLQAALDAGVNDYIIKTGDIDLLRVRLAIAERQIQSLKIQKQKIADVLATNFRLTSLFDNMQTGVLYESKSRHVINVNRKFCSMFDLPAPEALIDEDVAESAIMIKELFPDLEGFVRRVDEIIERREVVLSEEFILSNDRVLERDYIPLFQDGKFQGHFWLFRDVTKRKKVELELIRVHEREIETSAKIQSTLLFGQPPLDLVGLQVYAITIPSLQIGGDFYDFHKHGNHYMDIILGDVMGKGVPAALLGAATKSTILRAINDLFTTKPFGQFPLVEEIVGAVHEKLTGKLIDLESFITMCYGRFNLRDHNLYLVDCGHNSPIHFQSKTGTNKMLHGDNMPIGFSEAEIYCEIVVQLEMGDIVLLYTDGVTDAKNSAGVLFGEERLASLIKKFSHCRPEELIFHIRMEVAEFSDSDKFTDDLTCMVIKIEEGEEERLPLLHKELMITSNTSELVQIRTFVCEVCKDVAFTSSHPGVPPRRDDGNGITNEDTNIDMLELAVNEAATNVMIHAYNRQTDRRIWISADVFNDRIVLQLFHYGDAFDPKAIKPPSFDGTHFCGFGAYIIEQIADDVTYRFDDQCAHCIRIVKKLRC